MRSPCRFWLLVVCLCALPLLSGCFFGGGATELDLDGEQLFEDEYADVGEMIVLDMRDPGLSGYEFCGTIFDPEFFRFESMVQGEGRAQFSFFALKEGETTLEIRICREAVEKSGTEAEPPATYKRVAVTVE